MGAAPSEQPQCYQHRLRASVFVEEKNLFCKRSFNISKTSWVLALYHESHLQDAAGTLVSRLKVFGLLVWRANECRSRNESAVQFCHLQLTPETAGGSSAPQASSDLEMGKQPLN